MRKIYLLLMLIIFSASTHAQIEITGSVKDADTGEPLPGATIVVQGSTIGTTTDIDGNYSVFVTSVEDILIYSYVGYIKEEMTVGPQTIINMDLRPDTKSLDEVIVTAIGIKREKKSLGYSAQEVKGDELIATSQPNIVNSLSSKVAGVEITSSSGTPGASSNIVIRGRTSLGRSNSPLFVVDGVPVDNSYDGSYYVDHSNRAIDINPNDIESVTVLKGATATALYGIMAANGAIIITTKSGEGRGTDRKQITFRTSIGFDEVNKLPEKQYRYAQGFYNTSTGAVEYSSTVNTSWGPLIDTLRYDGATDYLLDQNGRIVGMSDPTATSQRVVPYENVNDFFQTAIKSDTYLSMSGGDEKGNFHISTGHVNQSGIVPNSEFKRTTFKINGDMQISEKLKIAGKATYANSDGTFMQKGSNLSAVMVGLMRVTPTFDITNGSGDPVNDESAYMLPDGTQRNYFPNYDNPYWSINKNKAFSTVNRLMGNTQIDYKFTPWLNIMYRLGLDYYTDKRSNYLDNNSSDTPDGYINISTYEFQSTNSDLILTLEKDITDKLNLTALLGNNYVTRNTYYIYQRGDKFVLPNYYDISNTEESAGDDSESQYKRVGAYYDIRLSYNDYLYFNTTYRIDWSSTLPASKNWFDYPSVNLSFIFSEAFRFKERIPFFSFGKLRASVARGGYDADPYSLQNYFQAIDGGIQGQVAYRTRGLIGNNGINPEETISYEAGVELKFFQNRLGVDFAYYHSESDNQIIDANIPSSSGYPQMVLNSGIISNKGFEIQMYATPVETKDFIWDLTVNFSKNKNIVEDLPEEIPLFEFPTTGLSSTRSVAIEGEPFGVIYGGRFLRNENGDVLVDDEGYPLIDTEAGIVGDPNPDFIMGLRNTFSYKGLSLTAVIDIKEGGDVFNGTRGVMTSLGTHKYTENRDEDFIFDGVNVNTGLPNEVPVKRDRSYYSRQGGLAGLSEAYIEDGSYIRLREVSLSYNLPSKWFEKIPVSNLSIGLSGRNLLLFTDYSGIDPETNLSGASNSLGRDYFNMPNTRSYEINLLVNF